MLERCLCGAMDCRLCHPEGIQYPECFRCGEEFEPDYIDDILCEKCSDYQLCDCCDCWHKKECFTVIKENDILIECCNECINDLAIEEKMENGK